MLLKNPVKKLLAKIINFHVFSFDDDNQEYFKPYFANLSLEDLKWSIEQEHQSRETFKYACKPNKTYESFQFYKKELEMKMESKDKSSLKDQQSNLVQGLHSYNILQNPEYQQAF